MTDELPASPPWDGVTLQTKHDWFRGRPGAEAIAPASAALAREADLLGDSSQILARSMHGSGVDWQGHAADRAAAALNQAARWAADTSNAATLGSSRMDRYGDSWTTTKNRIAAPVPEGAETWWGHVQSVFGVQSDYQERVSANRAADQAANEALAAHDIQARQSVATFGPPGTTPSVTTGSAAAAGYGTGLPSGATGPGQHPGSGKAGPATTGGGPRATRSPRVAGGGAPTTPGGGQSILGRRGTPITSGGGGPRSATAPATGPANSAPTRGASTSPYPAGAAAPGWPPADVHPSANQPVPGFSAPAVLPVGAPPPTGPLGGPIERPGRSIGPPADPLAPRGGGAPGLGGRAVGAAGAGPAPARPAPTGQMAPMGHSGTAPRERSHRNATFLPSDEPFVVQFEDLSPPVLGVSGPAEPTP